MIRAALEPYLMWVKLAGAVALAALIWWAAVLPRQQLSSLRAKHAEVTAKIAESAAKAAEKAKANVHAVAAAKAAAAETYRKGVEDAYIRGEAFGRDAAAGTGGVRVVWRDRCPGAPAGQGAGLAGGAAPVPDDRAASMGRVLGIAGAADSAYLQLYQRLEAAQAALNQCYDKPAH